MTNLFVLVEITNFQVEFANKKKTLAPSEPKGKPSRASHVAKLVATTRFLITYRTLDFACAAGSLVSLSSLAPFALSIRLPMTSSSYSSSLLESF
jgi:hypothetical protein